MDCGALLALASTAMPGLCHAHNNRQSREAAMSISMYSGFGYRSSRTCSARWRKCSPRPRPSSRAQDRPGGDPFRAARAGHVAADPADRRSLATMPSARRRGWPGATAPRYEDMKQQFRGLSAELGIAKTPDLTSTTVALPNSRTFFRRKGDRAQVRRRASGISPG